MSTVHGQQQRAPSSADGYQTAVKIGKTGQKSLIPKLPETPTFTFSSKKAAGPQETETSDKRAREKARKKNGSKKREGSDRRRVRDRRRRPLARLPAAFDYEYYDDVWEDAREMENKRQRTKEEEYIDDYYDEYEYDSLFRRKQRMRSQSGNRLLKPLRKKSSKRRVEYRQKSKGTACITY
jgi:hypothetical protein